MLKETRDPKYNAPTKARRISKHCIPSATVKTTYDTQSNELPV